MKKKIIVCFLLNILVLSSTFANFDYQFDLLSLDPNYKEYFAYRGRSDLSISYLYFTEGFPDKILQDYYFDGTSDTTPNQVKLFDFNADIPYKDQMVELKVGETLGLARNTFNFDSWLSPISFDFSFQGGLSFFFRGRFDDNIGFDGLYFYGVTCKIGDFISLRYGHHHYCSHYGDAILKRIDATMSDKVNEGFWLTYKYVRMQTKLFAISIEPCSWLRVYGEIDYPPRDIYSVRPDMFAPNWITRNGQAINPDYPDSYNARIVATGVELTYPVFKNMGNTTIGYDLHLYEEGKVIYDHENGGDISFDDDAPWEMEHNIRIAQDLSNTISVELTYHNGRSPYNNSFFQHTQYVSVSFRCNPSDTLTLFNTKK